MMSNRMKVLIGYDGSSYAVAAIDELQGAGLPNEIDTLVVSVGQPPIIPPLASHEIIEKSVVGERLRSIVEHANYEASQALQQAKELAFAACLRLKSHFPSWHVRGEALAGAPPIELIRKANEWNADLIVVGSQGKSAIERFVLGSVSLKVASESRCSVRIARLKSSKRLHTQPRIIIGMDGSPGAERAVRKILRRTWPAGTEMRIVAVDDGVSRIRIVNSASTFGTQLRSDTSMTASRLIEIAGTRRLKVSAEIKLGDPRHVLVAEAREWEADCIFVGTCGYENTAHGYFDDCVTKDLPAIAECSIEIVR